MRILILLLLFAIVFTQYDSLEAKRRIKRNVADLLHNNTKLAQDFVQLRDDKNVKEISHTEVAGTDTKKDRKEIKNVKETFEPKNMELPLISTSNLIDDNNFQCTNNNQRINSLAIHSENAENIKKRNSGIPKAYPLFNRIAVNSRSNGGAKRDNKVIDDKNNGKLTAAHFGGNNKQSIVSSTNARDCHKPNMVRLTYPHLMKITGVSNNNAKKENTDDTVESASTNTESPEKTSDNTKKTNDEADHAFEHLVLAKNQLNAAQQVKEQNAPIQQQQTAQANNKFSPMESMVKLANMFLSKLGVDNVPVHTQSAQISFSPIGADPFYEGEIGNSFDYMYAPMDSPQNMRSSSSSFILPPSGLPATGQIQTAVAYTPPFLVPQQLNPMLSSEPMQPFNIFENALDSFLNAPSSAEDENNDDDYELRCPVHIDRKSVGEAATGANNADAKNDILQVCACRFVKKNKKKNA